MKRLLLLLAMLVFSFPATAQAQRATPDEVCNNLERDHAAAFQVLFVRDTGDAHDNCVVRVQNDEHQYTTPDAEVNRQFFRIGPSDGNPNNDVGFRWTEGAILFHATDSIPPERGERFLMEANNPRVAEFDDSHEAGGDNCFLWHVNLLPVPLNCTDIFYNFRRTEERPSVIGINPPPPPRDPVPPVTHPSFPVPLPTPILSTTVSHSSSAYRAFTTFTRLTVSNVPAKAKVRVTCTKRGCKAKTYKTTKAKSKPNIFKPFKKRKLKVGTKITISITAPGFVGKRITYTIRKSKIPSVKVRLRP